MTASRVQSPSPALWMVALLAVGVLVVWLMPPEHAVKQHGSDAWAIADAYNQGAPCDTYESMYYNRRMTVVRMGPLNGLIFTTRYGAYITMYLRSPERTAKLIVRDGYVPVCEK